MPKWLRKSLVVMVTILTFGLVTPSYDHADAVKTPKKDIFDFLADENRNNSSLSEEEDVGYISKDDFVKQMLIAAEAQSFTKFGTRIKPVIENEFSEVILPNIEKAIQNVAAQYPEEKLACLTVSEGPGKGHSEKIFNIKNEKTNEDVIRFHVRRDQPPQQGYWFNFHYHTHHDQFQAHHDLGSIYWDKNTPPKWMS
ncbi:hypothetical protein F7731_01095 [Cytobacillus depressus]|uniref:YpjP family protein n=1 Tax=Cytobacillus depressus TaxID=1602942 RepID=A0A6L3VFY5_9BACI|nr:YpjP family protein [Cytobacillus depressus]KAB2338195.1 hypothetical protein F7731_01095 [Cytobacillus depressus]